MASGKENELTKNILDQKIQNFIKGYSHVLLCQFFFRQNGNSPFYISIEQDNQTMPLVIDERFIMAMNAGTERMYRELCGAGIKQEADEIMVSLRTFVESENGQ